MNQQPTWRCPNAGWWRGCKFEPRYDTGPATASFDKLEGTSSEGLGKILSNYRQVTYVRDVCIRCGKTIERNQIVQRPIGDYPRNDAGESAMGKGGGWEINRDGY